MSVLKPVPISSYGCVCACGVGTNSLFRSLTNNQTQLKPLELFNVPFDTYVGEVIASLPRIQPNLADFDCRNVRMALAALNHGDDELRPAVETARNRYGADRIGIVIGTSTSGLYETEHAYQQLMDEGAMPKDFNFFKRRCYQATAGFLKLELALKGPCYAISTACSSSAKALAAAQRLINSGICDAVLTGGIDTLCRLTLTGFFSLHLLSNKRCRPMDAARNGLNIGEGAGLFLLEKPHSRFQHKPHLISAGESSDAYHMSAPHPEGKGAKLAMNRALNQARLTPSEIDYVNLHATGTTQNDLVEAEAIRQVFGPNTPCSGVKGIMGHTLGAAGAIEAVASLLALEKKFIPGNCGLNTKDFQCRCNVIADTKLNVKLRSVMSNAFGFGGNNVSLIFSYSP